MDGCRMLERVEATHTQGRGHAREKEGSCGHAVVYKTPGVIPSHRPRKLHPVSLRKEITMTLDRRTFLAATVGAVALQAAGRAQAPQQGSPVPTPGDRPRARPV